MAVYPCGPHKPRHGDRQEPEEGKANKHRLLPHKQEQKANKQRPLFVCFPRISVCFCFMCVCFPNMCICFCFMFDCFYFMCVCFCFMFVKQRLLRVKRTPLSVCFLRMSVCFCSITVCFCFMFAKQMPVSTRRRGPLLSNVLSLLLLAAPLLRYCCMGQQYLNKCMCTLALRCSCW